MDEWLKTVLLGIVEGATEFLPISSTGHLLIVSRLVNFQENLGGTFEIFIQFGAVLAVIGYYAADLLAQARALPREPRTRHFWLAILIAFLPAAVVGLLLRDFMRNVLFASPSVIAWSFIIGGLIILVVELVPRQPPVSKEPTDVSWAQAIAVGCAQAVSLIPGVSRSGASIVGGLLVGMDRPTATAFSFYLAIPTLGAATLYDLARSLRSLSRGDLGFLLVGTVVSGVVAWIAIRWLLRYVAHHTLVPFGVYRVLAGAVILALIAAGRV
jgi:undecaprenyl-diphosphatase